MNTKSILLEATEYVDGASLAKAILRGQIAGISKKFFNGEEPDTKVFDKFLQIVKNNFDKPLQNRAIVLLLNKTKTINDLRYVDNQIINATKTYFDNVNKEEAKKPEVKELFDKFEEVNLTDPFNQDFENKINELFEDSTEMKSNDEYEVIYPTDEDGWEVVSPKTFGAAKYLSSFKGVGKAFWCTSAHAYQFRNYTQNGNKLYIIRNIKKGIFYQMDWGYQNKWANPSFQNFHNKSINVKEVFNTIPTKVLESIKNKDNETVAELIKKANDITKEHPEEKQIDKWKYKLLTKNEFLKLVKKYKINIFLKNLYTNYYAKEALSKEVSDKEEIFKNKFILLENKSKKYLFISTKLGVIINGEEIYFPLLELKKDDTYSIADKNAIAEAKSIPDKVKKYIYTKHEIEKPNYTSYSISGYKIYLIRNTAGLRKILTDKQYNRLKLNYNVAKNNTTLLKKISTKFFETNKKFRLLFISNKKNNDTIIINLNNINNSLYIENNFGFEKLDLNDILKFIKENKNLYNFINEKFPFIIREIDNSKKETTSGLINDLKKYTFKPLFTVDNKKFFFLNGASFFKYDHSGPLSFYHKFKDKFDFSNLVKNNVLTITPVVYVENNKVYNLGKQTFEKYIDLLKEAFKYFITDESYFYNKLYINLNDNLESNNKEYFNMELKEIKDRVRNRITES